MYYTIVMNYYNNVIGVYERPTLERAEKTGEFWASKIKGGWYLITDDKEQAEIYKNIL